MIVMLFFCYYTWTYIDCLVNPLFSILVLFYTLYKMRFDNSSVNEDDDDEAVVARKYKNLEQLRDSKIENRKSEEVREVRTGPSCVTWHATQLLWDIVWHFWQRWHNGSCQWSFTCCLTLWLGTQHCSNVRSGCTQTLCHGDVTSSTTHKALTYAYD